MRTGAEGVGDVVPSGDRGRTASAPACLLGARARPASASSGEASGEEAEPSPASDSRSRFFVLLGVPLLSLVPDAEAEVEEDDGEDEDEDEGGLGGCSMVRGTTRCWRAAGGSDKMTVLRMDTV